MKIKIEKYLDVSSRKFLMPATATVCDKGGGDGCGCRVQIINIFDQH